MTLVNSMAYHEGLVLVTSMTPACMDLRLGPAFGPLLHLDAINTLTLATFRTPSERMQLQIEQDAKIYLSNSFGTIAATL